MSVTQHHRRYHLHGLRVLFFGISLIGLCLVKIDAPTFARKVDSAAQVLAYATNISRSDLLAFTNSHRSANGLAPLSLNSQLNTSSQGKAQDMINNNYWAHVSPSGVQPWYWFNWAGYDYQAAGENLAYGFDSSSGVLTGWMNSPSHRANVLGDYADVGFGIANGDNYQGGPNTVVVAHYGKPRAAPPPPAPAPPPPAPTSTTPSAPTSTPSAPTSPEPTPAAAAEPEPTPAPKPVAPVASEQKTESPSTPATPVQTAALLAPKTKNINLLESVKSGTAPVYGFGSLALLVVSAMGFFLTHRALLRHAWVTSEAYMVRHPMMDIAAIGAITMLALTTTVSHI